jgi:hypothetical protein
LAITSFATMATVDAESILRSYDRVIKQAVKSVSAEFGGLIETDDLQQEASIRLVTYAGLMPGWMSGALKKWQEEAKDLEAVVSYNLKIALRQYAARYLEKTYPRDEIPLSLDYLASVGKEPAVEGWEDAVIERVDTERDMRRRYPLLAARALDDMSNEQMAKREGVSLATIERRIAKEKHRAELTKYLTDGGLRVEGNETVKELEEAAGYLRAAQARQIQAAA